MNNNGIALIMFGQKLIVADWNYFPISGFSFFFFFIDTATTEIYTLSLHDALPIPAKPAARMARSPRADIQRASLCRADRKSTRLNSSHVKISYAVFCLKKKKKKNKILKIKKKKTTKKKTQ